MDCRQEIIWKREKYSYTLTTLHLQPMRSWQLFFTMLSCFSLIALTGCERSVEIKEVPKEITSAVIGSGKTRVTVFSDYRCPACQYLHTMLEGDLVALAQSWSITLELKNFPLPQHKWSYEDALWSFCALSQGKLIPYRNALYAKEAERTLSTPKWLSSAEIASVGVSTGLDGVLLKQCIDEKWYKWQLEKEQTEAARAQIRGTPTIMINGSIVETSALRDRQTFLTFLDTFIHLNK